jgi:hypothetical protein
MCLREGGESRMPKRYCEYCGAPFDEHCGCEKQLAEEQVELLSELEERELMYAPQQDLIDLYRQER